MVVEAKASTGQPVVYQTNRREREWGKKGRKFNISYTNHEMLIS